MKRRLYKYRGLGNMISRFTYTILILVIYHLLCLLTLPGVNMQSFQLASIIPAINLLSLFSGGNFDRLSILSVGLTAFVNAQIVVQILQSGVSNTLTEWAKGGQRGHHKLNQLTKILTFIFSIIQAAAVLFGVNNLTNGELLLSENVFVYIGLCLLLAAGSFITMWLADQITLYGLGNGVSVIISANIIAQYLTQGLTSYPHLKLVIIIAVVVLMIFFIVFINNSERQLNVFYAKRDFYGDQQSYMPVKLLTSGVMPVVFASGVMIIPQIILLFCSGQELNTFYRLILYLFSWSSPYGIAMYSCLIIGFSFLYSEIQLNPHMLAENLQKQEAFIEGIYPGKDTEKYIIKLLNRMSFISCVILLMITVVPMVIGNYWLHIQFLGSIGSSLIIIVSVLVEIFKQARGLIQRNDYPSFLDDRVDFTE